MPADPAPDMVEITDLDGTPAKGIATAALAEFTLSADVADGGLPTVHVNGKPVDGVLAASVYTARGEIPRLILDLRADASLTGQGIVEVAVDVNPDEIALWLEGLDPEEVGRVALEGSGMGTSPPRAMMAHLIQLARAGQAPTT